MSDFAIAPNPVSITIGDGAGGTQLFALPGFGTQNYSVTEESTFLIYQWTLSYLNNAWGALCAKSLGVLQTPVTGSGQGTFGVV